FAANESLNRRAPANVNVLLLAIKNSGLMPPGLQISGTDGGVVSVHSNLLVRYRGEPLGIEILSLGWGSNEWTSRSCWVLSDEIKDTDRKQSNIYVATSLEQMRLPSPFAPEAEIFALGFEEQQLSATKLIRPHGTQEVENANEN